MVILVLAVVTLAALWYRLLVQEPSTASGGEAAMVKAVEQAQLFEPLLPLESPFPEEPEEPLEEPEQPAEPEPDQTVQPPEGTSSGSSVERVWELTNYYRSQYGAGTLTLDSTLCDDAATRAREIASYFSHTRLDGSQWYTVSSLAHGENIIMGTGMDADRAMTDWMNSQGTRDNILDGPPTAHWAWGAASPAGRSTGCSFLAIKCKKHADTVWYRHVFCHCKVSLGAGWRPDPAGAR